MLAPGKLGGGAGRTGQMGNVGFNKLGLELPLSLEVCRMCVTRGLLPMVAVVLAIGGCQTGLIWEDCKYVRYQDQTYWTEGRDSALLGRFGTKHERRRNAFHPEVWLTVPPNKIRMNGPHEIEVTTKRSKEFVGEAKYKEYAEVVLKDKQGRDLKVKMVVMVAEVDPDFLIASMNENPTAMSKLEDMLARKHKPRLIHKNVIILSRSESREYSKERLAKATVTLDTVDGNFKLVFKDSSTETALFEITNPVVRCYLMGVPLIRDGQVVRIVPDVPAAKDPSPF